LIPERKHDVLLRALAHVRRQFPSAKLTVVGDGPQRQALKSLAQELGLSEAVEFTGRVPVEEVSSYLGSADLYVSPTMAESFGLALVEAAAHGLPIIATPVGMAPVLILEGQTGRIIPAGDEHSLAEAIIGVIGNPIFRREAALLMPKRVEELGFTWPRCAERTAGIYRDLLVRRGNGRL
jgi:phosphatidylinositol alpha-1,6-mannosyltransferase